MCEEFKVMKSENKADARYCYSIQPQKLCTSWKIYEATTIRVKKHRKRAVSHTEVESC